MFRWYIPDLPKTARRRWGERVTNYIRLHFTKPRLTMDFIIFPSLLVNMATKMPDVDNVKNTGSRNLAPGIAGGIGVLLGSSVLGNGLGPIVGGTIAGATQSNDTQANIVTINGMMQGFGNMANGNSGGNSGGSRGRM